MIGRQLIGERKAKTKNKTKNKTKKKKKKLLYTAGSIKNQQTKVDIKKKEEPRPRYLHSCRCSSSELTHRCPGGGQETWSAWPQRRERERERENEENRWALGSPWAGVNSQQCLWWGAAARFWGLGAERAGQQQQISQGQQHWWKRISAAQRSNSEVICRLSSAITAIESVPSNRTFCFDHVAQFYCQAFNSGMNSLGRDAASQQASKQASKTPLHFQI